MSLSLDTRRLAMLAEMGVNLPPSAARTDVEPINADALATVTVPVASAAQASRPSASTVDRPPITPREVSTPVAAPSPAPRPVMAAATDNPRPQADAVASLDWTQLQQAVAECQSCTLCQQRHHTVFGTGAPDPSPGQAPQVDWMIVGEAPGEQEDLRGEPFVGNAGQLLDSMLKAIGLDRGHRVYIANVIKCRPPGNRNPEPAEVAQCEPFLRRQVALLQPKIILAMGRFAVQSLLGTTEPIGKLRGRLYDYQGVPVVVTYHPAYLLRNPADKAKAWADLVLALQTVQQA